MKDFRELLKNLGIEAKNEHYYVQALTHPSYENEFDKNSGNYQRLEFLGDAVLQIIVSNYIFKDQNLDEGKMTLLRSNLVKEEPLARMARYFNLGDYILLGHGEILSHGEEKPSVLSDVFEALLGAIYLDLGYAKAEKHAIKYIKKFIKEVGINSLMSKLKDPKTMLQETVQAESRKTVKWNTVLDSGTPNKPVFKSRVYLDEIVLGEGYGSTKVQAEENASDDALRKMVK